MTIRSKFSGSCRICRRTIAAGDQVEWVRGQGVTCPTGTEGCVPTAAPAPSGDLKEAADYLAAVELTGKLAGDDFLASLFDQFKGRGSLSEKQIQAVLKRKAKATGQPIAGAPPLVPDGRYAVEIDGEVALYRVWRGTRDPSVQQVFSVQGTEKGERVRGAEEFAALTAIAVDPAQAAIEFGFRTGSCSRCGQELEVNLSRHMGIGPVCVGHWIQDPATKADLLAFRRAQLRDAGIDPTDKLDDLSGVSRLAIA